MSVNKDSAFKTKALSFSGFVKAISKLIPALAVESRNTIMDKLITLRTYLGKLSLIALVIAFAGVLDLLFSGWMTPDNRFDMVRGSTTEIIGPFYSDKPDPAGLGFVSDTPGVTIRFDKDMFKGFWLGESMWRGHIITAPDLVQGTATLRITYKDLANIKPKDRKKIEQRMTYTIRHFENPREKRRHDPSLIRRYLAAEPWTLSIAGLPVIVVTGIIVFFLSGRIEKAMAESGKAEIYRVSKKDDQLEIHFGMGQNHGLTQGERLMLFNQAGLFITEIFVSALGAENASSWVDPSFSITPGFLVSRV